MKKITVDEIKNDSNLHYSIGSYSPYTLEELVKRSFIKKVSHKAIEARNNNFQKLVQKAKLFSINYNEICKEATEYFSDDISIRCNGYGLPGNPSYYHNLSTLYDYLYDGSYIKGNGFFELLRFIMENKQIFDK